jgi:phospholipid/cholesterol/gamma-HCH transport system permease protein
VIVVATFVGLFGGYFPVHNIADIGLSSYLDSVWLGLYEKDIWVELLKAAVFGTLISLVCGSVGYKARGGAIDVGVATTNAVVYSFIVIVITDFLISYAFFY